jgi:nitronate monooxygenase
MPLPTVLQNLRLPVIGSPLFIASGPQLVIEQCKADIVESTAAEVVYTNLFTGVHGLYLKKSIINAGLDPDNLPVADKSAMNFASDRGAKAGCDIWGAGQGVGMMNDVPTLAEVVNRLKKEYAAARERVAATGYKG